MIFDPKYGVRTLDYQTTIQIFQPWKSDELVDEYFYQLSLEWRDSYLEGLVAQGYENEGHLECYAYDSFTYCQDARRTEEMEDRWWATHRYDCRVFAVYGKSNPSHVRRDTSRLRYHRDSLAFEYGDYDGQLAWDKGHFIAHTIGGHIDNGIFAQRRDVNRGWGDYRDYRRMEVYAQRNPGIHVFSRPIYGDGSQHPFYIEYGLLKSDWTWWVEVFPNRYLYEPFRGFDAAPEWRRNKYRK